MEFPRSRRLSFELKVAQAKEANQRALELGLPEAQAAFAVQVAREAREAEESGIRNHPQLAISSCKFFFSEEVDLCPQALGWHRVSYGES